MRHLSRPFSDFAYELESSLLNVHGKLISVGLPDNNLPEMAPFSLVSNGCFLGGSKIGSKK